MADTRVQEIKVIVRRNMADFEVFAPEIPTPEQQQAIQKVLGYGDFMWFSPHLIEMKPGGYWTYWRGVQPMPDLLEGAFDS